ncbi:Solute carrier family 15 member 5 [Pelobates cultripes]|uniref:Solute carrier family 15 member 5 n=1 Tax=Pelobates cultripes TaxID=61616 RepID=A0AAD1WD55_PELCU|nr:Solute carrier family 15 member 5 [Pelobates cultripes]
MPLMGLRYFPSKQRLDLCRSGLSRNEALSESCVPRPGQRLQLVVCALLVELCERFTFFGTVCNMILFCTLKLGYDNNEAAIVNLCFVGTCTFTPVLLGWVAESCVGRVKVSYVCALLHFVGTALLPVVAFPFEDFYIDTNNIVHTLGQREQTLLFYSGLIMASIGIGGIRAVVCPLSAYNLNGYKEKELTSFFNWFYWLVNLNSLVVFSGISYIQQSAAKNLGFLIPFMSVVMALITIHMIRNDLLDRHKKGKRNPKSFFTKRGNVNHIRQIGFPCLKYCVTGGSQRMSTSGAFL